MAVVMRLSRAGAKKTAFYQVVVADRRRAPDGKFIEKIGYYDPKSEENKAVVNEERVLYWLRQGAKPSDTVRQILIREGIWQKR